MKRRSFLRTSSFLSLPMLFNGLPIAASGKQSMFNTMDVDSDKVLVLIQLNGGNDGLNTIIPLEHYDLLSNVRPNVIIPSNEIIPLEGSVGMHPNLTGIKTLYDDAKMSVIRDVGYPNQNRSHFRSTDIWTSGSPADENWTTGWLGKYMEGEVPTYPEDFPNEEYPDPFALSIGSNVSETCQGTLTNFSLALADPLSLSTLAIGTESSVPDSPYGRELAFLRTTIEQANAYGKVITAAAEKGTSTVSLYPDTNLASQLQATALLISGGLRTKVYIANLGGFDTHANQVQTGNTTLGTHANLMNTMSEAITAFQQDLAGLGLEERVVTMTFSEFGRRIRSNDSNGTDHGSAAPMLVFGSCVNAGVIGESSALPDNPSQSDGVPFQFDFRDVYGSILMDWFDVDESEVMSMLHNDFSYLPIVNKCNATTATSDIATAKKEAIISSVFPNPFENWITIDFQSESEHARISIYDSLGHEIAMVANQKFSAGRHEIKYDGHHLNSGNYFYRIVTKRGITAKSMVKM